MVAFGLCFWQNHLILDLLNDPLPDGREPLTLGVTEPFFTTLTVSAYAAILLALPLILYQLYAFVLPAFSPGERRVALPLLLMVPFLLLAGVVFGYFVVLPAAVKFLLNFNETEFNIQIRAREYYSFVAWRWSRSASCSRSRSVILAADAAGHHNPEAAPAPAPARDRRDRGAWRCCCRAPIRSRC